MRALVSVVCVASLCLACGSRKREPEASQDRTATPATPTTPAQQSPPHAKPQRAQAPALIVAPAPATPPPPVTSIPLVLPGGHATRDPVGLIIAQTAYHWGPVIERSPLHVEKNLLVYWENERQKFPDDAVTATAVLVRRGKQRHLVMPVGAAPIFHDKHWFIADDARVRRHRIGTSGSNQLGEFAGPIAELALHGQSLLALHDREYQARDAEVGAADFHTYDLLREHGGDVEGYVPGYSTCHAISRMPVRGGKPTLVVNEHQKIHMWAIGGSTSSVLAWQTEWTDRDDGTGDELVTMPGYVRVRDLGREGPPIDVFRLPELSDARMLTLAVDQTHVYWYERTDEDALFRKPWAQPGPRQALVRGAACDDCRLHVSDGYIYWSDIKMVMRMPVVGGPVEFVEVTGILSPMLNETPRDGWRKFPDQ